MGGWGSIILLLMMATAFMGYVLPWGQMSFWGATVITNLFSAIPLVGEEIVNWLWGGYSIGNPTLTRFYALHYLFPFLIFAVVFLHLVALHTVKSNNPLGIDATGPQDTIPFHPYYTAKDFFGFGVFFLVYLGFVFYAPDFFGEPDNYIPANPLATPPHIVPEWYFLPFYAILRAVPDVEVFGFVLITAKLAGVILMFGSILILFFLPWLDFSKVRSSRFRPIFKQFFWIFLRRLPIAGMGRRQPAGGVFRDPGAHRHGLLFRLFHRHHPADRLFRKTPPPAGKHFCGGVGRQGRGKVVMRVTPTLVSGLMAGLFLLSGVAPSPAAAAEIPEIEKRDWSFDGVFGSFDRAAQQRGYQVYNELCSGCHGLRLLTYRNLAALGYDEDDIKAFAAEYEVTDGPDEEGEMYQREALPSDHFVSPFANTNAARAANNGALPPDLSLIVKARKNGVDYIYALLTGYGDTPDGRELPDGMYSTPLPRPPDSHAAAAR